MYNKYEKRVLNFASKLDAVTDSDGVLTTLAMSTVEGDNNATVEIFKEISELTNCGNKQIIQIASALKDAIISYYGYLKVQKICKNEHSDTDDDNDETLDELLDDLNSLVGLNNVKNTVSDLITYQKIQKLREKNGLFSRKNTLHLAFTGNPGTGKTTVARIVGRVYKQIGLLSKGHFLEVSRTDLIAGYQGQTALKVKEVIERAKGGVLFIDEAYSITENDHSDSYGRECLTELTKALEDYRDDLVVIVAGYTEPMNQFFESNPGLKSRFNTFIEFDDYSSDELIEILSKMAIENDYKISDDLRLKAKALFDDEILKKNDNFSNGRLARNIYDDLVMAHAKRVNNIDMPTISDLSVLEAEDLKLSYVDDKEITE